MLALAHCRGLLRRSQHVAARRGVFVVSSEKKAAAQTKKVRAQQWAADDRTRQARRESLQQQKKLKELRSLTKSVARYVQARERAPASPETSPPTAKAEQAPPAKLGQAEQPPGHFDPRGASLLTAAVPLPASISQRLGLAVRYLVTKTHQNWPVVLQQLAQSGGFRGVPELDVRRLVYSIPRAELRGVFPQIEALLRAADMPVSPKIVNAYLKSVVAGGAVDAARLAEVEARVAALRGAPAGRLSRDVYETLVEAYGKSGSVSKMEAVIAEMRRHGLAPSFRVYSHVLAASVYKTRDHKQAVALFDSMRFLAGSMAPGTKEYQDIIVSHVNNNDVEKALDLYEDMRRDRVEPNQSILVALARGCVSRTPLRARAWDFIFDIYRRQWEPAVPTLEYMLYLAARDGDLALSRVLYQQLVASDCVSPRSFGFLMLAYAESTLDGRRTEYRVPAVAVHDAGRHFRRNILESASWAPDLRSPRQAVPFLPTTVLSAPAELLSESSAVMAHALLTYPALVSEENINTFLNVAARYGTLAEFRDRFDEFTFLDTAGIPATRVSGPAAPADEETAAPADEETAAASDEESAAPADEESAAPADEESAAPADEESAAPSDEKMAAPGATKSPLLAQVLRVKAARVPRGSVTYSIALKAAARNKNYEFSQMIWAERGQYRKSERFRRLPPAEREQSDFHFAAAMVHCLTELQLLDDALAILVSTEYQFKWTWKELRPLHTAAVSMGYDKVTATVRGIARRAQIKFGGKIRRKDYKRYVMERGF